MTDFSYSDYSRLMRQPNRQAIASHQLQYVKQFLGCKNVLDLGCGEGIFLKLLKEAVIPSEGVDRDRSTVEESNASGLNVHEADLFPFLSSRQDTYDGIFCSHVVEHLTFDALSTLLHKAAKALTMQGKLLLVFPNPESIRMQCFGFWKDPEHVRFYHADLIASVCRKTGLDAEEIDVEATEPPLTAPHIASIHHDWAPMDLHSAVRQYEALLAEPPRIPEETPGSIKDHAKRVMRPLAKSILDFLVTCAGEESKIAKQKQEFSQQVKAIQALLDRMIAAEGSFHEHQGELLAREQDQSSALAEQFNTSLGQIIQTLNSVWGVPEEAAVLAVRKR